MRRRALFARVRADERGFTLMELMMAATLCAVGLMAMMSTFDGSRDVMTAAERTEVASHRAESALEQAVARPYDEIALQGTSAPARSTDPTDPDNRITTSGTYTYRTGQPAAAFVLGGTIAHEIAWQDPANRMRGTIYYYVTEYRDLALDPTGNTVHGKRVTVAVTVNGRRRAVTTSTIVRDRG